MADFVGLCHENWIALPSPMMNLMVRICEDQGLASPSVKHAWVGDCQSRISSATLWCETISLWLDNRSAELSALIGPLWIKSARALTVVNGQACLREGTMYCHWAREDIKCKISDVITLHIPIYFYFWLADFWHTLHCRSQPFRLFQSCVSISSVSINVSIIVNHAVLNEPGHCFYFVFHSMTHLIWNKNAYGTLKLFQTAVHCQIQWMHNSQ